MAEELLNLDLFNDLDVNLDYLDQYLGFENQTTNDLNHKFESNINSYNNYNQNIDLNSAQNQCFDSNNVFENQSNCQIRYETYNNFNQINGYEWMSQKDQVFNPPLIPAVNTSLFDSYYCQQIDGQLSSNPYNGFNGIDSNPIQKFWEPIG